MTRLLFLRPEAEQDLATARDWYDQKRAGLGNEFLDAIALALRELERDPELHRLYYRNFRRMLLRRFPYKIFYQVLGERIVIFSMRNRSTGKSYRAGLRGAISAPASVGSLTSLTFAAFFCPHPAARSG